LEYFEIIAYKIGKTTIPYINFVCWMNPIMFFCKNIGFSNTTKHKKTDFLVTEYIFNAIKKNLLNQEKKFI
jgi:hypothetical protein